MRGESYKEQALKAAKDLNYSSSIIKKIKAAKTDDEIYRIMHKAREGKEKEWWK